MSTPASVAVDDDLPACESGVCSGAADHKPAGGLEMEDCVVVEESRGDDGDDDVFSEQCPDLLCVDVWGVLGGDDDCVDTSGDHGAVVVGVLDSDLCLAVRAEPWKDSGGAEELEPPGQGVGEDGGDGHPLVCLVCCIAEHDALVAGTQVQGIMWVVEQSLCNVGALGVEGKKDGACVVVEAEGGVVVADVADDVASDELVVYLGVCGDLACDEDESSGYCNVNGDSGSGVLTEALVEYCVADLVAELVGVTWADGF